MAKNLLGDLAKLNTNVADYNVFDHVIRSQSPSLNWAFGNSHGIPLGLSAVFIGPAKSGKSLLVQNYIQQMQKDYPDGIAVVFDTEFRNYVQSKTKMVANIDHDRVVNISTNVPREIFDVISNDIVAHQQKNNNNIKIIVIDSLSMIAGRRTLNADSIDQMQIGDQALTISQGLMQILPVIRKYKIALLCTAHVRAEISDKAAIMRGETLRAALPWAAKHMLDYWLFVEQDLSKAGKVLDEQTTDMRGKNLQLGHKVYARMMESSNSPKNRVAKFTVKYDSGISNVGEELADLGTELGVIEKPNLQSYKFGDLVWRGRNNLVEAIDAMPDLQQQIIEKLKNEDMKNIVG